MGRKRRSYESVKHYIEVESNSGCKLITTKEEYESYKNSPSHMPLKLLCSRCKINTFSVTLSRFKDRNKTICYKCAIKNRSLPIQEVKHFIESNSNCKFLSKTYDGVLSPIELKCECGNIFVTTFHAFKEKGKRFCNDCGEKIRRQKISNYTYNDVLNYIESKGCLLLTKESDYQNSTQDLWIIGTCNHMFQISFIDFKNRKSYECHDCLKTEWDIKKIRDWFKSKLPGYKLKSRKYKNQKSKLKIQCPKGHDFEKSWVHILRGQLCPICTSSGGAQVIYDYLKRNNIDFKQEFCFEDCKYEKPLPFDFAVFHRGKLKCLIEFDGRQHFEPVDFGDMTKEEAEEQFKIRQRNDQIKNEYCKKNKIKLIRIPYWEFQNIETILDKHLMKEGVLKNAI